MRIRDFQIDIQRARFQRPHCIVMLRPWINVGNVGNTVINRIACIKQAKRIGQLARPSKFYDFTRYRPRISLVDGERRFTIPNTEILAAPSEDGRDILLLKLLEPHAWAEDFNESVLELLSTLDVERYVLVGSMYDSVPHSRPLKVTGSARGWEPPQELFATVRLAASSYQGPTSMVSQITERVRRELDMQTLSMIVHLPLYLKLDDDYAGAARILSALATIYGTPVDQIPEIGMGKTQYGQIRHALSDNNRLKELVAKLEREYDSDADTRQGGDAPNRIQLNPEVERFLRDVSRPIDNSPEEDSDQSGGI